MTKLKPIQVVKLHSLIKYSDKYQINIQFWPEQTAVYISKDDVDLKDFGGSFDFAIDSSLQYLERINH